MRALPFILLALCFLAIAYRYYSAFIAAKVLCLDPMKKTPAIQFEDGQNYVPTPRWILFGHHFAAITGAGPLIGPVLAAQFGFLPGFLWLVIGVVIGGAVHDFIILVGSIRHDGKSIASIARSQMGPWAGRITAVAVICIIVIALAGLGLAVVNALRDSAWGTFTIASTIPVAFFMGLYMYKIRPGAYLEATIFGVICLVACVIFGKDVAESSLGHIFSLSRESLISSIAIYGFMASVLPVWLLLCPRDYLSSFMKLGTIVFLSVAVMWVNPSLQLPMFTKFVSGGGPIIPGHVFPFVFITIACGSISGFHSLIASGTTPKMIKNENDCRMIGYGAMLCEGWVGLTSLIAAAALFPEDYFAINVSVEKFAQLGMEVVNLPELSAQVGETVAGRPGGAVSLAVGMAQILSALPGLKHLMSYWYHFAILFEALFILTTIDTGTRVARFLVQETIGRWAPKWGEMDHRRSTIISTLLVVFSWSALIWTGNISTIWPLFGIANQLLACVALTIGTVFLIQTGKKKYTWVTLIPLVFVSVTTVTAGIESVIYQYLPLAQTNPVLGYLNASLIIVMLTCWAGMMALGAKKVFV
jgi:carbon starvation protein